MYVRNDLRLSRSNQLLYLCSYFNDINCIFKTNSDCLQSNRNLEPETRVKLTRVSRSPSYRDFPVLTSNSRLNQTQNFHCNKSNDIMIHRHIPAFYLNWEACKEVINCTLYRIMYISFFEYYLCLYGITLGHPPFNLKNLVSMHKL